MSKYISFGDKNWNAFFNYLLLSGSDSSFSPFLEGEMVEFAAKKNVAIFEALSEELSRLMTNQNKSVAYIQSSSHLPPNLNHYLFKYSATDKLQNVFSLALDYLAKKETKMLVIDSISTLAVDTGIIAALARGCSEFLPHLYSRANKNKSFIILLNTISCLTGTSCGGKALDFYPQTKIHISSLKYDKELNENLATFSVVKNKNGDKRGLKVVVDQNFLPDLNKTALYHSLKEGLIKKESGTRVKRESEHLFFTELTRKALGNQMNLSLLEFTKEEKNKKKVKIKEEKESYSQLLENF